MAHLHLTLLGGFAANLDGQPITTFGADKVRALLAYLAVESARPHRRAELAAMFWPESPDRKAAHNLSQALLRLRRALREEEAPAHSGRQPFLLVHNQDIQFNPLSDYRFDVADFVELIRACRQHQHVNGESCRVCIGWLQQAADLYRGDLLAGFSLRDSVPFEEWQVVQQEVLHRQAVEVLTALMTHCERRDEPEQVQEYARRLVALEPWQEQAQVKLMAALARCGRGAAALEQYATYRRMVARQFGMAPSAEARTLYDQIRARQSNGEGAAPDENVPQSAGLPVRSRPQSAGLRYRVMAAGQSEVAADVLAERGERRQVTALVCGRRDLARRGDPEDLYEQLAHCDQHCTPVLERYGGCRQQRQGAECLIYFGYPAAYEDAARRAVHAGLAIAKATEGADRVHAIGIHTGVMVSAAGELIGDAPDVARECQRLAEPDSVMVTADTERLLRGWFDCQVVGPRSLPGSTDAILVYRVEGERAAPNRLEWLAQTHRLTRFVGREQEMKQLAACLVGVEQGRGQVITLCGEPGIGKSRLVWELMHVRPRPFVWLESRCSPYFQNTSLYPLIRLLEQLLDFRPGDGPEERRDKLDRTLARLGLAQPAFAWLLALLLGLPTDTPAPQTITEDQRERMREAFLALLSRWTAEQPVALVIEDLHWADPSTVAWLGASLDALAAARCLTLLTYRPAFTPPWRPRRPLLQLTLGPLDASQVELMVADLTSDTVLPAELRRRVIAQADGIPLFVEELTRALSGADPQTPGGDTPSTLRDSLLARLDRVGAARETAGWAAALGREFAYPVLAAVVPYAESRLQADLATLIEADLVNPPDDATHAAYAFRHALIQEAVYAALLRRTRQKYHRRIAETYTARCPQLAEMQPEILAEHYSQAGLRGQAADHWLRAGERAAGQGAATEARACFERVLALIEPHDRDRRWRALRGRQAVLFLTGERAAGQADIAALLALAEEADSQAWRAEALLCRLQHLNAIGAYPEMPPLADDVMARAQAAGRPELKARALCLKAAALTRLGEPAARQTAEEAVACSRAAADEWAIAYAAGMLALHEAYAGDYGRAAQFWLQVLELVQRSGDRTLESRALSNLGAAYQYLGLFDDAQRYLEKGVALCELIGDRHSHAYNVVNLGGVMLLCGDLGAAKRLFEQGLSEATAVEDACLRAGELWDLGRLAAISGDYGSAIQYLAEARQIYTELGMTARSMETMALFAKCALGQNRLEDARHDAGQAWSYLQEHGTTGMDEALPTHLALAEVFETLAASTPAEAEDPTVRAIIEAGYELVMARAARISDPRWQQSFLDNVPSNRAMVERWQRIKR